MLSDGKLFDNTE